MKTYAYAVIDGNQAPDQSAFADSCHHTLNAAIRVAECANRKPNSHYYVLEWGASRWAKLRPNDSHYPCAEWLARQARDG